MVLSVFDKNCRIGLLFSGSNEGVSQKIIFNFNKLNIVKDFGIKLAQL